MNTLIIIAAIVAYLALCVLVSKCIIMLIKINKSVEPPKKKEDIGEIKFQHILPEPEKKQEIGPDFSTVRNQFTAEEIKEQYGYGYRIKDSDRLALYEEMEAARKVLREWLWWKRERELTDYLIKVDPKAVERLHEYIHKALNQAKGG